MAAAPSVAPLAFDVIAVGIVKSQVGAEVKVGSQLSGIVAKLRKRGYNVGGHDDYKKVPKGFAPDHPRADFLKMRGLTAGPPAIPKGLLHKPGFADWLVEAGKTAAPMVSWLVRNVK